LLAHRDATLHDPARQTLLNRVVVRLRALVILPNRDLALQVKSVFDLLCEGTDLNVRTRTHAQSCAFTSHAP
jgi:ATP-dependent RNA helicase DDX51/DBP6